MPPSPTRAPPALPDMTLYWTRRRKPTAEQTPGKRRGTGLDGGGVVADDGGSNLGPRTVQPALSGRAASPHTPVTALSRTAPWAHANVQVTKLVTHCLVVLLFLLTLTAKPAMAKRPTDEQQHLWINEQPNHVIFRYQICQPRSSADLERQCRESGCQVPAPGKRDPDPDYQQDEPPIDWESEYDPETSLVNGGEEQEEREEEKQFSDRRTSFQPQRRKLRRGLARSVQNKLTRGRTRPDSEGAALSSILLTRNMKKRRRSAEIPESLPKHGSSAPSREDQAYKELAREDSYDRLASDDVFDEAEKKSEPLHKALMNAKTRARRKLLKQQIRKEQRANKKEKQEKENPPWHCNFTVQHTSEPNVFPFSYLDGKCNQTSCFYNLYECRAIRIQVKVLYRNSTSCNPLPNLSNSTVYEERWEMATRHATVGCECVSKSSSSKSGRSRG